MDRYDFFATAPRGVADLLGDELTSFGAEGVRLAHQGVSFYGDLEVAYRACLRSRLAGRVLLRLAVFPVSSAEELYQGCAEVPWEEHLGAEQTLAVDATGKAPGVDHTRFAALKVKDALVDRLRDRCGERPTIDLRRPDLRIRLHLEKREGQLFLDLSGESLHRRGYRSQGAQAPLKENLAAAILMRCGWPALLDQGAPLVDPMCGSGTLVIEGALMAARVAPGLLRERFGFDAWRQHDAELWQRLVEEAQAEKLELPSNASLYGYDMDDAAVQAARVNAARAGVTAWTQFAHQELEQLQPPDQGTGLVVCNPPYGERLGDTPRLGELYARFGEILRSRFAGWSAGILTGAPALARRLRVRAERINTLYNGALECRLFRFGLRAARGIGESAPSAEAPRELSPGAEAFANRLQKNLKRLNKWAKRSQVSCLRLYDADLPEYNVAIDRYEQWLHVQEYAPPAKIDSAQAQKRLVELLEVLPQITGIPPERTFLKERRRQKGNAQYQKFDRQGVFYEVSEGACRLLVNFTDYLDTGLFLDHRPLRLRLHQEASGKRFLNLFCYTGAATVQAASGGASSTVSVDLSKTYTDWARRNLALNRLDTPHHRVVRADVREWLERCQERFDLIFLDPPSYSRSKRMQSDFDIQRDHASLLAATARLLAPGGVLYFSTNLRSFTLDDTVLPDCRRQEISARTHDEDFSRKPLHSCWRFEL